jgi:hypothetical protein
MGTFITKGTVVTNPSNNNIGGAQFVRVVSTGTGQVITVKNVDSNTLGEIFLQVSGDDMIIEKAPSDLIHSPTNVKAHAVGSPRG